MCWLECEALAVWGTVDHGGEAWWLECEVLAVWGTVDHGGAWWQGVRHLLLGVQSTIGVRGGRT